MPGFRFQVERIRMLQVGLNCKACANLVCGEKYCLGRAMTAPSKRRRWGCRATSQLVAHRPDTVRIFPTHQCQARPARRVAHCCYTAVCGWCALLRDPNRWAGVMLPPSDPREDVLQWRTALLASLRTVFFSPPLCSRLTPSLGVLSHVPFTVGARIPRRMGRPVAPRYQTHAPSVSIRYRPPYHVVRMCCDTPGGDPVGRPPLRFADHARPCACRPGGACCPRP